MNPIGFKCLLVFLLFTLPAAVLAQDVETPDAHIPLKQFIVHFSLGPAWDQQKPPQAQMGFSEHSANMQRLRSEGVIIMGARYAQIGMLIIQSSSLENATAMIQADPAVQNQIFNYTVEPVNVFYSWKIAPANS